MIVYFNYRCLPFLPQMLNKHELQLEQGRQNLGLALLSACDSYKVDLFLCCCFVVVVVFMTQGLTYLRKI